MGTINIFVGGSRVLKMIPKKIHFSAPTNQSKWPQLWLSCLESWERNFPDFEIKVWNDEEIEHFIKDNYPQYLTFCFSFPRHIMVIDFFRLCIMHKLGGIYSDMDVYCYKNFYDDLQDDLYVVGEQNGALSNHLMVSEPNNQYWIDCMEQSIQTYNQMTEEDKREFQIRDSEKIVKLILNITGPGLLTKTASLNKSNVNSLPWQIYNNNHLSYRPDYITKHMLTGIWGKEGIDSYGFSEFSANYHVALNRSYKNFRKFDPEHSNFYRNYNK